MSFITVQNNQFLKDGKPWAPKGVGYQPNDNVDPLADGTPAELIKKLLDPATKYGLANLNINAIRVYHVDYSKSHDDAMKALKDAGIYVLVGCVNDATAIPGDATSPPARTIQQVKNVADAFSGYDNVMGYSISNELISATDYTNYKLCSVVKEVKQQMLAYMNDQGYRRIPIGCASRDWPPTTYQTCAAYTCGAADDRMDFVGYNSYRWVVPAGEPIPNGSLQVYHQLYEQFLEYPVPVLFAECGAACSGGREWTQIPYIFGVKKVNPVNEPAVSMPDSISGCFAFKYYNKENGYGLVGPIGSDNPQPVNSTYGGYTYLAAAYSDVTSFIGTPNGVSEVKCSSLPNNPYAGNGPPPAGQVSITVKNYADVDLKVVQNEQQIASLPAGSETNPTSTPVKVDSAKELFILQPKGEQWSLVCKVAANTLTEGATVADNVPWGEWCNVS